MSPARDLDRRTICMGLIALCFLLVPPRWGFPMMGRSVTQGCALGCHSAAPLGLRKKQGGSDDFAKLSNASGQIKHAKLSLLPVTDAQKSPSHTIVDWTRVSCRNRKMDDEPEQRSNGPTIDANCGRIRWPRRPTLRPANFPHRPRPAPRPRVDERRCCESGIPNCDGPGS